ncbi:hypothetical protein CYMTET_45173 [Cymbomonas tetramitiformis]|uniref:Uncharacterized protein n=1 Tax=Cymbomonas tetramitiformis TaxID=36881 RepID=A0AAE0BZZ6_9CHLO|nr:hypothetical protein CYMTET_45173 [Cymbomonas tetramitiformis]
MDPYELSWSSLVYSDGTMYQGLALGGQPHGKGAILYSRGHRYEGDFVEGLQEGYGVYRWTDGSTYKGRWQDGVMQGCGRKSYADGNMEEGEFIRDVYVGQYMACGPREVQVAVAEADVSADESQKLLLRPLDSQKNAAQQALAKGKPGSASTDPNRVMAKIGSISSTSGLALIVDFAVARVSQSMHLHIRLEDES